LFLTSVLWQIRL